MTYRHAAELSDGRHPSQLDIEVCRFVNTLVVLQPDEV